MDHPPKEKLQIGRVAFAKAFCAEWISEHSKTLIASFTTLIVLTVCLFQVSNKFFSDNRSSEQAFKAWASSKETDSQLLKKLETGDASLKTKFGNQIAQRLLVLGEIGKAQDYAKATLKRTHDLTSSYYSRFSNNTLSIASGNYGAALEEAKQLKNDLEKDDTFWNNHDKSVKSGTVLYAYNLLRIASLERELGSIQGELAAWDEFLQNAGWNKQPKNPQTHDPDAYSLVASNFQQGETSLLNFIEERKTVLEALIPK